MKQNVLLPGCVLKNVSCDLFLCVLKPFVNSSPCFTDIPHITIGTFNLVHNVVKVFFYYLYLVNIEKK